MTTEQKYEELKIAVREYLHAQKKHRNHPGGGASQKIKNKLWEKVVEKGIALDLLFAE